MADGVTMHVQGLKEINLMFNDLPKQVNKDTIWGRFWKKATVELLAQAQKNAPVMKPIEGKKSTKIGIPYPPNKSLTIMPGTLKRSIQFFRTRASRGSIHGAYIGPRVKGKFSKNKGGYFGAWVEFGATTKHFGKFKSENQPFMADAWRAKNTTVMSKGIKLAADIFMKAVKSHTKRLKKYGLGY